MLALAGAFVHRHCYELGLPLAIAAPAAHLAEARLFDALKFPPATSQRLKVPINRVEMAQKAPVFCAIALMARHALRAHALASGSAGKFMVRDAPCV
jgi:hypothetical protein